MPHETPIRDLAAIGDRRTAAIITRHGEVVWYCPGRFDRPSLLAALLDRDRGGSWKISAPGLAPARRSYIGDSGVLETELFVNGRAFTVTDFMPMGPAMGPSLPQGLCRLFSAAPADVRVTLRTAPDYARRAGSVELLDDRTAAIEAHANQGALVLYASHRLEIATGVVRLDLPAGQDGWMVLLATRTRNGPPTDDTVSSWREGTLAAWGDICARITYRGPYETQVADSLRALRLLTYEQNGGIIAAPTTSLPEVIGGERNYDYRYVWLRDAGMIVSALIRAGSDGTDERKYLSFICSSDRDLDELPLAPFFTLDGEVAANEETLDLAGYRGSKPVQIGNDANVQLQLDALGNVLLAAKLIYARFDTREHWSVVEDVANYLVDHWRDPDFGIWEERDKRQYTTSKVIVACGLDSIAEFAEDKSQAKRWRDTVADIRSWVDRNCINAAGAYAVVPGSEAVDVSAALFPVWNYVAPDAPEMLATIAELERQYGSGNLYRRHLERFDSHKEGAFLAGTFWVAQYWVMRGDFDRVRAILDAGLEYANDLGLFAEEADDEHGAMLGNFPQTFAHASFIGAVIDLRTALEGAE